MTGGLRGMRQCTPGAWLAFALCLAMVALAIGCRAASPVGVGGTIRQGVRRFAQPVFAPMPGDPREVREAAESLARFLSDKRRVVALTGAGISTESGVPDYRGPQGSYSRGHKPMVHDQFISSALQRQRYWARSLVGYRRFNQALPNAGHLSLSRLERDGVLDLICTQNVDGLHQRAGARKVIDLHGRNDRVVCLSCGLKTSRRIIQHRLEQLNREWLEMYVKHRDHEQFADGDADTDGDFSRLVVPSCDRCGGVLKPDVVFFGDVVPSDRVEETYRRVEASDGVLVVGTSLMVYSGFRFILAAHKQGKPIAVLNHGPTRLEKEKIEPVLKVDARAGDVLSTAVDCLFGEGAVRR